jgi:hypothetical protein
MVVRSRRQGLLIQAPWMGPQGREAGRSQGGRRVGARVCALETGHENRELSTAHQRVGVKCFKLVFSI